MRVRHAAYVIGVVGVAVCVIGAARPAEHPRLLTARYGAGAAGIGDAVYVVGGSAETDFIGDIERIDLRSGEVRRMRATVHPRRYLTAEAVGGRVYVVGGYDSTGALSPNLEIYDPEADAVTLGPSLPTPRYFASSAVLDGRIYVVGGSLMRGDSPTSSVVEIYDVGAKSGTPGPPLSVARQAEVVALDGRIYAIGGYDGSRATRVFEVLDPAEGRWRRLDDLPFPISAHRAVAVAGRIYTFGDYYEMGRVWVFDPAAGAWDVVSTDFRPARHAAAASVGDAAVVVGGNISTAGTFLDDVQVIRLGALVSDSRPAGIGPWTPSPRNRR